MILDVDAGNSYLKWALHDGDIRRGRASGRVPRGGAREWLAGLDARDLHRIRLSSVAGDVTEDFSRWALMQGVALQLATVEDGVGGLRCGYREPSRLGIDRWLALLAARDQCGGAFAVVDAGTALTVDVVDGRGRHLGGYIAPGLTMMADSLVANTWGVRTDEGAHASLAPGTFTAEAVMHGCLASAVGLVEAVVARQVVAALFLTGGDADILKANILSSQMQQRLRITVDRHLVLAGLSIALP
ncbi:MAG: type III pantothenate kinase [Porticoccaceae bacterium]